MSFCGEFLVGDTYGWHIAEFTCCAVARFSPQWPWASLQPAWWATASAPALPESDLAIARGEVAASPRSPSSALFSFFWGGVLGSPTKIVSKKGTLILTFLLEDLVSVYGLLVEFL